MLIASYAFKDLVPTDTSFPSYTEQIDYMVQNDVRYTRVWHLLPWANPATVYWPWAKRGSDTTCFGSSGKWDLSAPDPDPHSVYWRLMTEAIARASESGITSQIMLFDRPGMRGHSDPLKSAWRKNPWNPGNNVNNFPTLLPPCEGDGVPGFYQIEPNLDAAQKAYVRTMIDRTVNCNVIYEIENEHDSPNDGGAWAARWGRFIKDHIGDRYPHRLVSYSSLGWWSDLDLALENPDIHIINRHLTADDENDPGILETLNQYITQRWGRAKAINIDEFGNGTDLDRLRKMAWVIVTSGGHFHLESPDVDPPPPQVSPADVFKIVNNIHAFLEKSGWDFVANRPVTTLSPDQPYCMAPIPEVGGARDYVCYNTGSHATSGLRLYGLPAGKYHIRWWNPRAGGSAEFSPTFDYYQDYDGPLPLTTTPPPDGNDWVLFLRQVSPPTETPPPRPHDVAVTKDDGLAVVVPGQPVSYAIKVTYPALTARRATVRVEDVFPVELAADGPVTWTCAATGGASCTPSGSGDIDETVELFGGSSVTFTATGTLSPTAMGTLSNTATVTVTGPDGVSDPDTTNNSATDVDVIGGPAEGAASDFFTITPCRLVDTRNSPTVPILQAGQTRDFAVAGECGIPATAKAVSLNVTVTQPGAAGYVRLVPAGDSVAGNSTVNYSAAQTRANNGIVSLSADGKISAYVGQSAGTVVHIVIDVTGYFE